MNNMLEKLEENIDYSFKNKELLMEAMSHSSYINERKINKTACNERLEFLGDAVLELASSDYLFKKYGDIPEGKLSKMRAALVCEPALYECSKAIDLGNFIKLGKGEEASGGRNKPSVVSDAFEALLGAVYLDGGMEEARKIILRFILTESQIEQAHISDSKSYLQELVQAIDMISVYVRQQYTTHTPSLFYYLLHIPTIHQSVIMRIADCSMYVMELKIRLTMKFSITTSIINYYH